MNPLLIRDARTEDADAAAAVHVDAWRTAYRGIIAQEYLDGLSYAKRREGFLKGLADPNTVNVVAEARGKIVGFARGGPNIAPVDWYDSQIYALYVLEPNQRQGVGRMLFLATCQRFVEQGLASMTVCALEDNASARAFYERMGGLRIGDELVPIGRQNLREIIYGWDDIRRCL